MNFFVLAILSTLLPIAYSRLSNDRCLGAFIIPSDIAALPYTNIVPNFDKAKVDDPTYPKMSCGYKTFKYQAVWYYWEPSSTTFVDFSFSTPHDSYYFDPLITIFEGEDCNDLKSLTCSYRYVSPFEVTAGKKYFFSISAPTSRGGFENSFEHRRSVTFGVAKTPPVPPNDECVDAMVIPSTISFPFSTTPIPITSATENLMDPVTNCEASPPFVSTTTTETVWYTWTPKVSGRYDINTDKSISTAFTNSEVSTVIEIFEGKSCGSVKEVTCGSIVERLRGVKLAAGIKYFIKVMTQYGDYGTSIILTVNPKPSGPVENDDCINAIEIDPFKGDIISGDTFYATSENRTRIDSCYVEDIFGLWYKFSVPKAMRVEVSTCNVGTTSRNAIFIFSGDKCGKLKCIDIKRNYKESCDYGQGIYFFSSEPTTYYILVGSYDQGNSVRTGGDFALTVDATSNYFTLIDPNTDTVIQPIDDYEFLIYADLPSQKLNIQASFNNSIKSAMMTFDYPRRAVCVSNAPFVVFGSNNSDYFGVPIPLGTHTVTATPYNQANCEGPAGTNMSRPFDMRGCIPLYNYKDFSDNFIFPLYNRLAERILSCKFNIEARPLCGFDVGLIDLTIRDTTTNQIVQKTTERKAPFWLFGNRGDDINQGSLKPGNYTIELIIDGIKHVNQRFFVIDTKESCE